MPVLFKGRKKNLEQKDLYRALKEHKSGEFLKLNIIYLRTYFNGCYL